MERKIRILHVAQAAGGVNRYLQTLLKYIDHDRFENIVVLSQDYSEKDFKNLAIAYEVLVMQREINRGDFTAIIKLRRLIKKYRPDIVCAHSSKAGAITRIADIGLKNKCIYNPHGWAFIMRCSEKKRKLYVAIEKLAAPFCKKIICISPSEKESALEKRICKEGKMKVIFNGIDIEGYENHHYTSCTRESLGIPEDAIIIGMVGRLSPQKAPDIFIRVAKRIKESIKNSYFIIVGSGEQEGEVIAYARENNLLESLIITGWVNEPMSYVELFDIAVLLSRWEGFGLALPEYMIARKPIVASRVDAIPDIIADHKNGILVEPNDIEGTYQAVMELLQDTELRSRLIEKAYCDVHVRFDVKRVAKEYEELIYPLLRPKKQ